MFEMNEVLNRKDLFCNECFETLNRVAGGQNSEKRQIRSLAVFMSAVYAFWVAGLVVIVHLPVA